MHGHWDVKETDINEVRIRAVHHDRLGVNVGIAVVVPAKKILEILNCPKLVEARAKFIKDKMAAEGITIAD